MASWSPQEAQRLTTAIAAGDAEATAALYEARFAMTFALARTLIRASEDDCLDVAHDAWLRVIRKMRPLPNERALDAWLAKVVRSAALDHLRKEQRRRARELAAFNGRPKDAAAPTRVEAERALSRERLEWLSQALASLDPAEAALLELRFRCGLTLEKAGRIAGLAPGSLHRRLGRTLAAIGRRAAASEEGKEIDDEPIA